MDRAKFYDALRSSTVLFGRRLKAGQVEGMEMLLDVWAEYYADDPLEWLAYNLGTAYRETGATMQPIVEWGGRSYFNRYDIQYNPHKARELGNVYPGDGFRYRGEGHVQNTGRRNARKASQELNAAFNLGIDLEKNPSKRGDQFISAHSLFMGNREGWWTGRGLGRYIDPPTKIDFVNARRVVNGTDKARLIAGYARAFLVALEAAGGRPTVDAPDIPDDPVIPAPPDVPEEELLPPPQPPQSGFFVALMQFLGRLFT